MNKVVTAHRREFSAVPDLAISAPGTISFLGEHSESAGGRVLIGALEERMTVAVSVRKDTSLRFYSETFDERKKTSISTLKWRREDRWANNSKGVIFGFMERGIKVPGLEVTIGGDVPNQVGLGSSSAICVATAVALDRLLQTSMSADELIRISVEAESVFQDLSSGKASCAAALLSEPGSLMIWDSSSDSSSTVPFVLPDTKILWVDPQVPITAEEREMVEQRLKEAQGCVDILNERMIPDGLLRSGETGIPKGMGSMPEDVRRGCKHLRDDEQRLSEAILALQERDAARFGRCLYRSHDSLRDLYEISNPEIDWLVRRRDAVSGVLGGRRTGINASASIVLLVQHDAIDEYMEKLQEYERIFGFTPNWRLLSLAGGALIESDYFAEDKAGAD
ncbi:galactokinase [Spirochaeta dissipatitropha]